MKFTTLGIFSIIVLLTTSCATMSSKKDAEKAVEEAVEEAVAVETPATWSIETVVNNDVPTQWLESFNDPILLKLIEEGRANNSDLQVAAGNMDKAWLLAKQSGSALTPTVDLSLGGTRSGTGAGGASIDDLNVGLQASWEVDVWGRARAGVRAAEAGAQTAQADYIFAQHSLSANIAKTYFKVIEANLQADISRRNLKILEKIMRIAKTKYDNGMSYLFPSPAKGSACKRPMLFLRWMIRSDDVDPGGWNHVSPDKLIDLDIVVYHNEQRINCKICKDLYHSVEECPWRRQPRCYNCQQTGHIARECPNTRDKEEESIDTETAEQTSEAHEKWGDERHNPPESDTDAAHGKANNDTSSSYG